MATATVLVVLVCPKCKREDGWSNNQRKKYKNKPLPSADVWCNDCVVLYKKRPLPHNPLPKWQLLSLLPSTAAAKEAPPKQQSNPWQSAQPKLEEVAGQSAHAIASKSMSSAFFYSQHEKLFVEIHTANDSLAARLSEMEKLVHIATHLIIYNLTVDKHNPLLPFIRQFETAEKELKAAYERLMVPLSQYKEAKKLQKQALHEEPFEDAPEGKTAEMLQLRFVTLEGDILVAREHLREVEQIVRGRVQREQDELLVVEIQLHQHMNTLRTVGFKRFCDLLSERLTGSGGEAKEAEESEEQPVVLLGAAELQASYEKWQELVYQLDHNEGPTCAKKEVDQCLLLHNATLVLCNEDEDEKAQDQKKRVGRLQRQWKAVGILPFQRLVGRRDKGEEEAKDIGGGDSEGLLTWSQWQRLRQILINLDFDEVFTTNRVWLCLFENVADEIGIKYHCESELSSDSEEEEEQERRRRIRQARCRGAPPQQRCGMMIHPGYQFDHFQHIMNSPPDNRPDWDYVLTLAKPTAEHPGRHFMNAVTKFTGKGEHGRFIQLQITHIQLSNRRWTRFPIDRFESLINISLYSTSTVHKQRWFVSFSNQEQMEYKDIKERGYLAWKQFVANNGIVKQPKKTENRPHRFGTGSDSDSDDELDSRSSW